MQRNKKDCLLGKTEAAPTQMEWRKDDISRLKIMPLCVPRGRSGFKQSRRNSGAEYTQQPFAAKEPQHQLLRLFLVLSEANFSRSDFERDFFPFFRLLCSLIVASPVQDLVPALLTLRV
jgi:hypothetical protein